jgi:hypothetical protein
MGCASKGIPVQLVEDGTENAFVLLPPKDDEPLPGSVLSKMEDKVTVTGHEYNKDGISFLQVETVK